MVNSKEFHSYHISFVKYSVHAVEAFPVYFRDVEQSFSARQEFNKCAKFNYAFYFAFVFCSGFRDSGNSFNPCQSSINSFFVRRGNIYITHSVFFFYNNN